MNGLSGNDYRVATLSSNLDRSIMSKLMNRANPLRTDERTD